MVYVVIAIGLLATFNFLRIFISLTVANLSKAYKIKKRAKSRTASSLKQYGISVLNAVLGKFGMFRKGLRCFGKLLEASK